MSDWAPVLKQQAEWSKKTFGPDFHPEGIVDHIQKECLEILADPTDTEEWIDVLILAFDGLMKQGYTEDEIFWKYVAKQTKNQSRKWPDWKLADRSKAVEHVRGFND